MNETYMFNRRLYLLAVDPDGWTIITGRPGETPVRQPYADEDAARAAWRRMLAATIVSHPRRLRCAQINETFLVLAIDADGQAHLGELTGPGGDTATAYMDRAAALAAWRDRCCELAHAATPGVGPNEDEH